MNFKKGIAYFLIPLWKPGERFEALFFDKNMLAYSFIIQLFIGIICTISTYVAWTKGFGAVMMKPWLNISAEDYYSLSYIFTIPISFLTAIFSAGLLRLLCAPFSGKGRFENNFAIYVMAMTLPTFLMVWLPDNILLFFFSDQRLTPLGGYAIYPEWLDNFRRTIGAALWPLIIMVVGVRKSEGLSWIKVILAVLFTFIPAAILTLVFIR